MMWRISTVVGSTTLAGTLTGIFLGLRWLEWLSWAYALYLIISVLSLSVRAGISVNNRAAIWVNTHAPKAIQWLGMKMSETIPVRVLFWMALLLIGYWGRDIQSYREFTQRPNIHWTVMDEYPATNYHGTAYDLLTESGSVVENFVPCEPSGWYIGLEIVGAAYYNRGECMSFHGPRAYIMVKGRTKK